MPDIIMTPEEMLRHAETPEGRKIVFNYVLRARIAFAMQQVFERIGCVPEPEAQMECCKTIYETLTRVPLDVIMRYIEDMARHVDASDLDIMEPVGEC